MAMDDIYGDLLNEYFKNDDPKTETLNTQTSVNSRIQAEGNISNSKEFGDIINNILNKAWGTEWGIFSPDIVNNVDSKRIKVPQINYSTNLREYSPNQSNKPRLVNSVIEKDMNNNATGYITRVYSELFDNIIEFNFWDTSNISAEKLMQKFEELIITYSDYLKNEGISEIFFLKEVPSKYSLRNIEDAHMKCVFFFVRYERIRSLRVKTLQDISKKIEVETLL